MTLPAIPQALEQVHAEIRRACLECSRNPESVRLLAVSKGRSASALNQAFAAGQHCFGENRLQEALDKQSDCPGHPLEWHFIGALQKNKAKRIAQSFDWVQSIDRIEIAEILSRHAPKPLQVLIQVNAHGETQKAGVPTAQALSLARQVAALDNIVVRGLMTIGPAASSFEAQCALLKPVAECFAQCTDKLIDCDTLSMGMSSDLRAAIHMGSTMVRIGTGIFGAKHA